MYHPFLHFFQANCLEFYQSKKPIPNSLGVNGSTNLKIHKTKIKSTFKHQPDPAHQSILFYIQERVGCENPFFISFLNFIPMTPESCRLWSIII